MKGCYQMSQPISAESNTPKLDFFIFFLIVPDFGVESCRRRSGSRSAEGVANWRTRRLTR
jgi:hypothetical protein